jgi:hypothetical protein
MHPVMLQELAAQRVKDMIAHADAARRARQARRASASDSPVRPARGRPPAHEPAQAPSAPASGSASGKRPASANEQPLPVPTSN